jgi:hypothetical protein
VSKSDDASSAEEKSTARNQIVTILVGGQRRVIFWIEESSKQDLTVILRYPKYIRLDLPGENPPKIRQLVDMHFSVHRSLESPTRINAITGTIHMDDKAQNTKALHYTKAMKQNNQTAHVFAMRSSNLDHDQFIKDDIEGDFHSLGFYDPDHFQLLYQVLVSSKDTPPLSSLGETNCKQIDFAHFRITILWTFVSMGSDISGHLLPFATIKPEELDSVEDEDLKKFHQLLPEGFATSDLHELFLFIRTHLKDDYIRRNAQGDLPQNKGLAEFLSTGAFFRTGDKNSSKYLRHNRRRSRQLRDNPVVFPK